MTAHDLPFLVTLGTLLALAAVILVRQYLAYSEPDARLSRDLRRGRRPW